jgi:two-component system response regulator NreC
MSIRILIADDHRILRAGLKSLLDDDPRLEVVGEAINGDEAVQKAVELHPDIVLMDISMPGLDGLEATRSVLQSVPQTKVLILTMHNDSALVQEYLRAGVSGYILKQAAESELIDAIYAVWRGMIYIHPTLMNALVPHTKDNMNRNSEGEALTPRELDILRFLVRGYTNRQIADELQISVRTVETHRANLMEKLNLHSRVDLVRYAAAHGLEKMDDLHS